MSLQCSLAVVVSAMVPVNLVDVLDAIQFNEHLLALSTYRTNYRTSKWTRILVFGWAKHTHIFLVRARLRERLFIITTSDIDDPAATSYLACMHLMINLEQ